VFFAAKGGCDARLSHNRLDPVRPAAAT